MFCGTSVGIARDVLAHVARQRAGIEVVAAAGTERDRQRDALAFVEIGDALRVGGEGEQKASAERNNAGVVMPAR